MSESHQKPLADTICYQAKPKETPVTVNKKAIQTAAEQRSKEQTLFKRILDLFKRDKRFTEVFINGVLSHKRVAVSVNGILESFETETDRQQLFGAIFKGKIQNLESGLKAAFVDIGQEKNAFLHYWDILPCLNGEGYNEHNHDDEIEIINREERKSAASAATIDMVPERFPIGSDIIVQAIKSCIGTKGPRVTTHITLPGRYLILTPCSVQCGISKKIENKHERERLKGILKKLMLPNEMGVIFRTASNGCPMRHLVRDLQVLLNTWRRIKARLSEAKGPCLLYTEPTLLERIVRDVLTDDVDRVLVDNEADFAFITERVKEIAPHMLKKIKLYRDSIPIFERFNVECQIEQTLATRIPLPSGGEIVIQETEALTAVDVNTSSHKGGENKTFIFQVNLEAAREIIRQIRLRNIGGVTIVDFVDMKQAKGRRLLFEFVQKELETDKVHTQVFPLTQLGLMQISRQRHTESLHSQLYAPCCYCNGEGKLQSFWFLWMKVQTALWEQRQSIPEAPLSFKVVVNPLVKTYWLGHYQDSIQAIEHKWSLHLNFSEDVQLHVEHFRLIRQ